MVHFISKYILNCTLVLLLSFLFVLKKLLNVSMKGYWQKKLIYLIFINIPKFLVITINLVND